MITGSSVSRDVARTTVVGGRSPDSDTDRDITLCGVEEALKRAAGSRLFRERLFRERSRAVLDESIPLDESERALLDSVPEAQLRSLVRSLVTRYKGWSDRTTAPSP